MKNWDKFKVPDEKVILTNTRGAISFARSGKETRGKIVFINLQDNPKLDTIVSQGVTGYPAFGNVIRGMEVVDSLYSGYGENTMKQQKALFTNRQLFLNTFPKLDIISKGYILKTKN